MAATKKTKEVSEKKIDKKPHFFDYLRFGESYTSLLLGIIVVILATAFLLSFVHSKSAGSKNTPINEQMQNTVAVSQKVNELSNKAPSSIEDNAQNGVYANNIKPTAVPKATLTVRSTMKPKAIITANPLAKTKSEVKIITKKITISHRKFNSQKKANKNSNIWIVKKGESLWIIAKKKYTSGYSWVDIAKANNLANPSDIHVGDRLILPSVQPQESMMAIVKATVITNDEQNSSTIATSASKKMIISKSYVVVHGDNLWDIAVRAYGDGYKWTDIAKANNLANPGMIFSGNILIIPR